MQDCYCPATGQHPVPERRWRRHRQQCLLPKHRCALICTPGPGKSFASGLLSAHALLSIWQPCPCLRQPHFQQLASGSCRSSHAKSAALHANTLPAMCTATCFLSCFCSIWCLCPLLARKTSFQTISWPARPSSRWRSGLDRSWWMTGSYSRSTESLMHSLLRWAYKSRNKPLCGLLLLSFY